MIKLALTFMTFLISMFSYAQIEGTWKTIDDQSHQAKSYVEIFKASNGKYYGKVVKLLVKPDDPNCTLCKGNLKGKPILGLEVIQGLKKEGDKFTDGSITDPKTGKTYKCTITRDGNKLNVRGYIGFSLIGRTQTWYKVD